MKEAQIIKNIAGTPIWDIEGLEPIKMDNHNNPVYEVRPGVYADSDGWQMGILDMINAGLMTQDDIDNMWKKIDGE